MPPPHCRWYRGLTHQVLEHECALIELAAHWADLHHPESRPSSAKPFPGTEQGRQLGGQGTPEILEFAAAELGGANGDHCRVRPRYEIPRRIREAMFLRMPASCFPYAAGSHRMDLDHTKPYRPPARGGPSGQTGVHNLGPMARLEHRIKTHSRWRVRQPEPGFWIWRSPHRAFYLVSNAGTQDLGNGLFARAIWRVAAPARQQTITAA